MQVLKSKFVYLVILCLSVIFIMLTLTWNGISIPYWKITNKQLPSPVQNAHDQNVTNRSTSPPAYNAPDKNASPVPSTRIADCSLYDCQPCNKNDKSSTCSDILNAKNMYNFNKVFKRKVLMSVDMEHVYYAWYVPLSSIIWYNMNWTPIIAFVGMNKTNMSPLFQFISDQTKAAGGQVVLLNNNLPVHHYFPSTVISASRLALPFLSSLHSDDYILTSDADMWPLTKEIFDKEISYPASIHIFDPKDNRSPGVTYSMCYIGMNASTWWEVLGYKPGDDMIKIIAGLRDYVSKGPLDRESFWYVDQKSVTMKIRAWHGYPKQLHFYKDRRRPNDRIDRRPMRNKNELPSKKLVDTHCLIPGYIKKNWKHLKQILTHLLTEEQMKFVENYTERFCQILSCFGNKELRKLPYHPLRDKNPKGIP